MHYKADINAPDNDGNTPLHLSTANGHEKVKRGAFLFRVEQRMCPKWPMSRFRTGARCWLRLFGWFSPCLLAPPSTKTNISKFQFDQDKRPARKPAQAGVASSLDIVIFIYLSLIFVVSFVWRLANNEGCLNLWFWSLARLQLPLILVVFESRLLFLTHYSFVYWYKHLHWCFPFSAQRRWCFLTCRSMWWR